MAKTRQFANAATVKGGTPKTAVPKADRRAAIWAAIATQAGANGSSVPSNNGGPK